MIVLTRFIDSKPYIEAYYIIIAKASGLGLNLFDRVPLDTARLQMLSFGSLHGA